MRKGLLLRKFRHAFKNTKFKSPVPKGTTRILYFNGYENAQERFLQYLRGEK